MPFLDLGHKEKDSEEGMRSAAAVVGSGRASLQQ